jgi:hypothetical protein
MMGIQGRVQLRVDVLNIKRLQLIEVGFLRAQG